MSATTTNHAIPYPVASDKVADFPTIAMQAADKIDAALTPTAWANVTMSSGWTVGSTLRVRKIGRLIELRGQFGNGSAGNTLMSPGSWQIGTLPSGYRPAEQIQVAAAAWQQGATPEEKPAVLVIASTGVITLHSPAYGHAFHTSIVFGV